jgi:glucose uptake protein GlcU
MKDGTLNKGELRRAVAGSLVLAFTLLALFSIVMGKENEIGKEIVIAYIQLVGIAVGFYFGAKTAEKEEEEEDKTQGLNDAGKATALPGQNPEKTTEE